MDGELGSPCGRLVLPQRPLFGHHRGQEGAQVREAVWEDKGAPSVGVTD